MLRRPTRLHLSRLRFIFRGATTSTEYGDGGSKDTGFYYLFPEEPLNIDKNPLLKASGVPKLKDIKSEECMSAILKLSLDLETGTWALDEDLKDPKKEKKFDTVLKPLDKLNAPFSYVWGVIKTLNVVKNNLISSQGYEKIVHRGSTAKNWQFKSLPIYHACKELSANEKYTSVQHRLIDKYILEAKLSGIDLQGSKKHEHEVVLRDLGHKQKLFQFNLMLTQGFKHVIVDPKYFGDMPPEILGLYARDSTQPQRGPWSITLEPNNYKYFLEYCPESALRWNSWLAYNTRASGEHDKNLNNSVPIEDIREKRKAIAKLLGYKDYIELSMQTKMAGLGNAKAMISTLLKPAKEKQAQEFQELSEFAASRGYESKLNPWDIHYWRRKMRKSLYNVDDQIIREYFPFDKTFENLCRFSEKLFNINISQVNFETWDESVKLYKISDDKSRELGHFFIDPFKREGKLSTVNSSLSIRNRCDQLSLKPLSCLIYNFEAPKFGRDTLLTFDQLYIIFKQFGTLLQQILTRIPYTEVSGTTNIEWDALGVPSNFMALWLGNREVVKEISSHEKTGEVIPDKLLSDLLNSRKHFNSFDLCHELYLSALDLELHESSEFWKDIVKKTYPIYHPFPLDKKDFHLCSFTEILTGHLGSSYYSKLWSKLLAADIYRGFIESNEGYNSCGIRFRETFFEMGGGSHPSENFRNFRGRDPSADAFLWSIGIHRKMPSFEKNVTDEKEELKVRD